MAGNFREAYCPFERVVGGGSDGFNTIARHHEWRQMFLYDDTSPVLFYCVFCAERRTAIALDVIYGREQAVPA